MSEAEIEILSIIKRRKNNNLIEHPCLIYELLKKPLMVIKRLWPLLATYKRGKMRDANILESEEVLSAL
jgi:hypothetical protein